MVANLPVVIANLNKVFQLAEPIAKFTPFDGQSLSKARLCRKKLVYGLDQGKSLSKLPKNKQYISKFCGFTHKGAKPH